MLGFSNLNQFWKECGRPLTQRSFQLLPTLYNAHTRQDGQHVGPRFPLNCKWGTFRCERQTLALLDECWTSYCKQLLGHKKRQTLVTFSVSHHLVVFLTRARLGRASPIPSRLSPCLNCQPEGPCTVGGRSRRFRLPPPDICRCSSSGQPVSCHKTSRGFHRSGASCQASGGRYHILTRRRAASVQVLLVISSSPGTSLTDSPLGDLKGWTWERK